VVSAADPHGRNIDFLDRSGYFFFQVAVTSPKSGGRSVGIVRSRTQTMEFVCLFVL
jgi:hypothetical protein